MEINEMPANLQRADLSDHSLRKWVLSGLNMVGVILRRADLSEADLTRTWLDDADLASASLFSAKLLGTQLRGASLAGANLTHADLASASLARANLTGAAFNRARLRGANFTGATLTGADFRGADLERARGINWWQGGSVGPRRRMVRAVEIDGEVTLLLGCRTIKATDADLIEAHIQECLDDWSEETGDDDYAVAEAAELRCLIGHATDAVMRGVK